MCMNHCLVPISMVEDWWLNIPMRKPFDCIII